MGRTPGGVHFELTGQNVTECIDGASWIEQCHARQLLIVWYEPQFAAEQFHARLWRNNDTRLATIEWLWAVKRA